MGDIIVASEQDYERTSREIKQEFPEIRMGSGQFWDLMRERLNAKGFVTHSQIASGVKPTPKRESHYFAQNDRLVGFVNPWGDLVIAGSSRRGMFGKTVGGRTTLQGPNFSTRTIRV